MSKPELGVLNSFASDYISQTLYIFGQIYLYIVIFVIYLMTQNLVSNVKSRINYCKNFYLKLYDVKQCDILKLGTYLKSKAEQMVSNTFTSEYLSH